jgi:tetratricopeptide (TPR) repeat protein
LDPGYLPALSRMADAYAGLGNYEEALNYAEKLKKVLGDPRPSWLPFAEIYARMGKRREAVELLRQIEKEGEVSNSFPLAILYTALGDRDHAISALERGVQARSLLPIVFVDPRLDALRADSRFQKLTRRVGLPLSIPKE